MGPRLLALTGEYLSGLDVLEIGKGFVGDLAQQTGETVTLAIANEWEMLVIAIENVPDTIINPPRVGFRMPIYATAVGKAVMAFRPEEAVDQYLSSKELRPFTPYTITDKEIIKQELSTVQKEGVAFCREGFREYVVAMGAPIFNYKEEAIASLSVSMLSLHVTREKENEIKLILCDTATKISQKMGLERLSKFKNNNEEFS
ncbi:IclR family transcriptional regulator [Thermodesulfobacteriota bacterium]